MKENADFESEPTYIKERLAHSPVLLWYYCHVILPLTANRPTRKRLLVLFIIHLILVELLGGIAVIAILALF